MTGAVAFAAAATPNYPRAFAPTESGHDGGGTTHNMNMPATVVAGELLLTFITYASDTGSFTITTPSGWTKLWDANVGSDPRGLGAGFAKVAAGTEGGTTVNFGTSINVKAVCAAVYRVTNWFGSLSGVEVGTPVTVDGTTTPDPPSLTPSWGVRPNLWFVVSSGGGPNGFTPSAYPTNYGNGESDVEQSAGGALWATLAHARRGLTAASENPGAFTLFGSMKTIANTVAVRPRF